MEERESLFFADFPQGPAWVLASPGERHHAQARLLSGKEWPAPINAKAKTLPGSIPSTPIGSPILNGKRLPVALCEGGPDFLSVMHHAQAEGIQDRVAPVMMAGTGNLLSESFVSEMSGGRVRIFIHNDRAGMAAATKWASQLTAAGVSVDGFDFSDLVQFSGEPVNDLNDLNRIDVDSWEEHRDIVENVLSFAREEI